MLVPMVGLGQHRPQHRPSLLCATLPHVINRPMLGRDHHGSPTLGCTAAQARNPDGVAHTQTLGRHNYLQPPEYILITNFDFFFHDVRELFDPTGGHILGTPRRVAARRAGSGTPPGMRAGLGHRARRGCRRSAF
uniref:Uncharacterized protein n=1 Tax=Emiliania huxleyi TaxID=2903 RepID=A0A7S3S9H7_EMIHU